MYSTPHELRAFLPHPGLHVGHPHSHASVPRRGGQDVLVPVHGPVRPSPKTAKSPRSSTSRPRPRPRPRPVPVYFMEGLRPPDTSPTSFRTLPRETRPLPIPWRRRSAIRRGSASGAHANAVVAVGPSKSVDATLHRIPPSSYANTRASLSSRRGSATMHGDRGGDGARVVERTAGVANRRRCTPRRARAPPPRCTVPTRRARGDPSGNKNERRRRPRRWRAAGCVLAGRRRGGERRRGRRRDAPPVPKRRRRLRRRRGRRRRRPGWARGAVRARCGRRRRRRRRRCIGRVRPGRTRRRRTAHRARTTRRSDASGPGRRRDRPRGPTRGSRRRRWW